MHKVYRYGNVCIFNIHTILVYACTTCRYYCLACTYVNTFTSPKNKYTELSLQFIFQLLYMKGITTVNTIVRNILPM